MSLMKGLDEKAKKKDVDGIFMKLDRNQNGLINLCNNNFVNNSNNSRKDLHQ